MDPLQWNQQDLIRMLCGQSHLVVLCLPREKNCIALGQPARLISSAKRKLCVFQWLLSNDQRWSMFSHWTILYQAKDQKPQRDGAIYVEIPTESQGYFKILPRSPKHFKIFEIHSGITIKNLSPNQMYTLWLQTKSTWMPAKSLKWTYPRSHKSWIKEIHCALWFILTSTHKSVLTLLVGRQFRELNPSPCLWENCLRNILAEYFWTSQASRPWRKKSSDPIMNVVRPVMGK